MSAAGPTPRIARCCPRLLRARSRTTRRTRAPAWALCPCIPASALRVRCRSTRVLAYVQAHVAGGSDRVHSRVCCSRRLTIHGRPTLLETPCRLGVAATTCICGESGAGVSPRSRKIPTRLCQRQPEAKGKPGCCARFSMHTCFPRCGCTRGAAPLQLEPGAAPVWAGAAPAGCRPRAGKRRGRARAGAKWAQD